MISDKEILDNAELIAKFLGWELCECAHQKRHYKYGPKNYDAIDVDMMDFHCSWDKLMPVVSKITNETTPINLAWHDVSYHLKRADIKVVYNFVVEFIKWYNECKPESK